MANTVNDVMNVIASPDYGIKNIAGTNQEILAILEGTHNSQNNIHNIVNDVKCLLQILVGVATEKKVVEVGDKSDKTNQVKNIKDILDETKGIKSILEDIAKAMSKQSKIIPISSIAKLSDKASDKVANALIESVNNQKKDGGISAIVDTFRKLKDISIKDIVIGKFKLNEISKIFKNADKDLDIKDKDFDAIIKVINSAPEFIKKLVKVDKGVNKIIKNKTISKLKNILFGKNSIFELSKLLKKHKKDFKNGAEATKKIIVIAGNLLIASILLTVSVATGALAIVGAHLLSAMVDVTVRLTKKLNKNKKNISKAVPASVLFLIFTGAMMLSAYLLSEVAKNGVDALLGSAIILGVVLINTITFSLLKKSMKNVLLGSIAMLVMSTSLILFGIGLKKIADATKDVSWEQFGMIAAFTLMFAVVVGVMGIGPIPLAIALGSLAMVVMGGALIVFGLGLKKVADATKDVSWEQFGMIAACTLSLGVITALIGLASPFIALGSLALITMSISLITFSLALFVLSKATDDMDLEQITVITGAIIALGLATTIVGLQIIPITLGSISLIIMSVGLIAFGISLAILSKTSQEFTLEQAQNIKEYIRIFTEALSDAGKSIITITFGTVSLVLMSVGLILFGASLMSLSKVIKDLTKNDIKLISNSIVSFGDAFKEIGGIKDTPEILAGAKSLSAMSDSLEEFANTLKKIKDLNGIPTKEVDEILGLIKKLNDFYEDNPVSRKARKTADAYIDLMHPFIYSAESLYKLKKIERIPTHLVQQTLDSMSLIANYYKNNPIDDDTIDMAEDYEDMLDPFSDTIEDLCELKKMGDIPVKLVFTTLDIMSAIANYYKNNPIDDDAIDAADDYEDMLDPFNDTIEYLCKLRKMGDIPIGLVTKTLDSMLYIANYYKNNPIDDDAIEQAENYEEMLKPFGKTIEHAVKLKEMGNINMDAINNILLTLFKISTFYKRISFGDEEVDKSEDFLDIVCNFNATSIELQNNFLNVEPIDINPINSIISAFTNIINYYKLTDFSVKKRKIKNMNDAIIRFSNTAKYLNRNVGNFSKRNEKNVDNAINSMRNILNLLKTDTLSAAERINAKKNMLLLKKMSDVMSGLSTIDSVVISSIGDALDTTLSEVNSIDISQVQAVTEMFNAFNGINKSESILNKFTESINEFTKACKDLMGAMGLNTDAINNMDGADGLGNTFVGNAASGGINTVIETTTGEDGSETKGIRISNVDEIARNIADKINGSLSIDIPDTQIQLLINGTGGNEWILTRY